MSATAPSDYDAILQEAEHLHQLGVGLITVIPVELPATEYPCSKDKKKPAYTGKNPSQWTVQGKAQLLSHGKVRTFEETIEAVEIARGLGKPIGLAIVPAENLVVIDFDLKDYGGDPEALNTDVFRLLEEHPELGQTLVETTPGGGVHIYVRVADRMASWSYGNGRRRCNFTTTAGGPHRGEVLSGTRISVTAPTRNGRGPYEVISQDHAYDVVEVRDLAAIGVFPVVGTAPQQDAGAIQAELPRPPEQRQEGQTIPRLEDLLGRKAQEVLRGGRPYGEDRSTNYAGFLRELHSWGTFLAAEGLPTDGSPDQLSAAAVAALGIKDKAERVAGTITPSTCTLPDPEKALARYRRLAEQVASRVAAANGAHPAAADGFEVEEAAAAAPAAEGEDNPPFTVVGWDTKREQVWYQHRQTGQLAQIRAQQKSNLLNLAPVRHWESLFPNKSGNGVDWTAACSYVIDLANRAGVFYPAAVRGRGVWLDSGRVVWHLGNRLEVDGLEIPLADHRSGHTYAARQPLPIDRAAAALTDAEGQRILLAVAAMGWTGPIDHLAVLGWAVCTVAAGAIPKRTGVQVTSRSASGKTTVTDLVWRPLLGGAGEYRSASTEAGIRQLLGPDALAVVVDETEAGEGRRREGMLRLMRHSYDGTTIDRGTTHGEALAYPVRFGMALIAINATTPEAADANRMVTVTRQHLPAIAWEAARDELKAAMPCGTADSFNRRVVDHLHTLLANVFTFQAVVGRQIGGGVAGRLGDTWAPLLAGAYLLTSAAVLTEAQAAAWLAENGWDAAELDAPDGDEEGVRLLDRILAYQVPWHSGDGKADIPRRSVRQLLEVARLEMAHPDAEAAAVALGQLGIKATASQLVIANSSAPLAPILNGTRWADGGHVARLRDLPGADFSASRKTRIGRGSAPERATYLPWGLIG